MCYLCIVYALHSLLHVYIYTNDLFTLVHYSSYSVIFYYSKTFYSILPLLIHAILYIYMHLSNLLALALLLLYIYITEYLIAFVIHIFMMVYRSCYSNCIMKLIYSETKLCYQYLNVQSYILNLKGNCAIKIKAHNDHFSQSAG